MDIAKTIKKILKIIKQKLIKKYNKNKIKKNNKK